MEREIMADGCFWEKIVPQPVPSQCLPSIARFFPRRSHLTADAAVPRAKPAESAACPAAAGVAPGAAGVLPGAAGTPLRTGNALAGGSTWCEIRSDTVVN